MIRIILATLFLSLSTPLWAEENTPPTAIDLPREDVLEYRALEAEARAIRAEANLALGNISGKREIILGKWKKLAQSEDLSGWRLDLETGKLIRISSPSGDK